LNEIQLSKNLNKLIAESGYSAATIAVKVGMRKSVLHNWCNGVSPQGVEALKKIADLFGISLNQLVYGKDLQKITITIENSKLPGLWQISACQGDPIKK